MQALRSMRNDGKMEGNWYNSCRKEREFPSAKYRGLRRLNILKLNFGQEGKTVLIGAKPDRSLIAYLEEDQSVNYTSFSINRLQQSSLNFYEVSDGLNIVSEIRDQLRDIARKSGS
jgi:hypothetical protein